MSAQSRPAPDVRTFTVGPIRENAHLIRADPSANAALLVDPGEEPQRLLDEIDALGATVEAILVTHCHFDHVGAVAPLAAATGAPVYCPALEVKVLGDIMRWVPPGLGFGPFESYEADHTLAGGERLRLADLDIEVLFTPGHSPGHLTYVIVPAGGPSAGAAGAGAPAGAGSEATSAHVAPSEGAPGQDPRSDVAPILLSGDVIFRGSVGRVDLPGGDWNVLERSIEAILGRFPPETILHPGHMDSTTLGYERATNPFLTGLRVPDAPRQRSSVAGGR